MGSLLGESLGEVVDGELESLLERHGGLPVEVLLGLRDVGLALARVVRRNGLWWGEVRNVRLRNVN